MINRFGWHVQVLPPSVDELALEMYAIEKQCGIIVPDAERDSYAKEIYLSMKGFRGIEEYALRCAQHSVVLAAKEKRTPKPPKSPENPDWF